MVPNSTVLSTFRTGAFDFCSGVIFGKVLTYGSINVHLLVVASRFSVDQNIESGVNLAPIVGILAVECYFNVSFLFWSQLGIVHLHCQIFRNIGKRNIYWISAVVHNLDAL